MIIEYRTVFRINIRNKGRKNFILTVSVHCMEVNDRIFNEVVWIPVVDQRVEHLVIVFDIVSVDDGIGARRFQVHITVHKRHTIEAVISLKAQAVIIQVVITLYHRIIQRSSRNAEPTCHILIDLIQTGEFIVIAYRITEGRVTAVVVHFTETVVVLHIGNGLVVAVQQIAGRP